MGPLGTAITRGRRAGATTICIRRIADAVDPCGHRSIHAWLTAEWPTIAGEFCIKVDGGEIVLVISAPKQTRNMLVDPSGLFPGSMTTDERVAYDSGLHTRLPRSLGEVVSWGAYKTRRGGDPIALFDVRAGRPAAVTAHRWANGNRRRWILIDAVEALGPFLRSLSEVG